MNIQNCLLILIQSLSHSILPVLPAYVHMYAHRSRTCSTALRRNVQPVCISRTCRILVFELIMRVTSSHVSCRESFPYRKYSCIINICKEISCYLCMWMERYLCKYNLIWIIDLTIFHDFLAVSYVREFDPDNWFVNFNKLWKFQFFENLLWIFAWIIFSILENLISWRI